MLRLFLDIFSLSEHICCQPWLAIDHANVGFALVTLVSLGIQTLLCGQSGQQW